MASKKVLSTLFFFKNKSATCIDLASFRQLLCVICCIILIRVILIACNDVLTWLVTVFISYLVLCVFCSRCYPKGY